MEEPVMKKAMFFTVILALIFAAAVRGDGPTVAEVTHWELQAVNANGEGTYDETDKVIITGIVLNNPEEMLVPTPATGYMGGQWQIYVQGEGGDHAGTAVYLGQYYTKVGGQSGSYTDEQLLSELCRINRDPNTGYIFAAGDRIKVTGWYKFYKGKLNVNEMHEADPDFDFEVELLEPAVGLPQPEAITLDMIKDSNDDYIFDQTRMTGCEYYQGQLVRVDDVNIVDPENWAHDATVTISDAAGLTFPVKLGIGDGFARYDCPTGQIDVIAIFDQESSGTTICKDGYRLWVVDYDGNGLVLTDRGHERGNLPGDINTDYKVDLTDFAELAANWLEQRAGLYDCE
jgi:hypothetical protein